MAKQPTFNFGANAKPRKSGGKSSSSRKSASGKGGKRKPLTSAQKGSIDFGTPSDFRID